MQPLEKVEDLRVALRFDADAIIFHPYHPFPPERLRSYADFTGARFTSIFDRIAYQVLEQFYQVTLSTLHYR